MPPLPAHVLACPQTMALILRAQAGELPREDYFAAWEGLADPDAYEPSEQARVWMQANWHALMPAAPPQAPAEVVPPVLTEEWMEPFLAEFAKSKNLTRAAKVGGVSRETAYQYLRHDPEFARAQQQALETFRDRVRRTFKRRALDGWDEPVFGRVEKDKDGIVGHQRRYDPRAFMRLVETELPEYATSKEGTNISINNVANASAAAAVLSAPAKLKRLQQRKNKQLTKAAQRSPARHDAEAMNTAPADPFADMSAAELVAVNLDTLSPDEQAQWEDAYKTTPIGFVELVLGLELYEWQDDALDPLDDLLDEAGQVRRIPVSVVAPNGSGKSERVVAGAGLYWLGMYPRGRVIVTSKDSKQINEQVWPALKKHERNPHFAGWHWVTSPYNKITTPTGGTLIAYTTNDEGRAEGAHMDFNPFQGNFDGPLLIIVDEAKSVDEGIFEALDRCGWNAMYYISSPGHRAGTFYESQTDKRENYICVKAGLVDCPHIPQSKIDSILAKYGEDSPFTRSTLYGEFMDAETQQRFDRAGLAHLEAMAKRGQPRPTDGRIDPVEGGNGQQSKQVALVPTAHTDPSRWFRWWEPRLDGCRYLVMCDSASGAEQQKGSRNPDRHSVKVLRDAYIDRFGVAHKPAEVARIIPPCHLPIERLADYIACLSRFYGNCTVVVEANNTGLAVIVLLQARGVPLYKRREGTPENPVYKDGFYTHGFIRPLIISELAEAIFQKTLDIWCPHTVGELQTFVKKPDGKEAAEGAAHDDDVLCSAIGLRCLKSGTIYRETVRQQYQQPTRRGDGCCT